MKGNVNSWYQDHHNVVKKIGAYGLPCQFTTKTQLNKEKLQEIKYGKHGVSITFTLEGGKTFTGSALDAIEAREIASKRTLLYIRSCFPSQADGSHTGMMTF